MKRRVEWAPYGVSRPWNALYVFDAEVMPDATEAELTLAVLATNTRRQRVGMRRWIKSLITP